MDKQRDPIEGEKIYVPSSFYVYRGADDFRGGVATIATVERSKGLPADHINSVFITIKERPRVNYNWKLLLEEQEELKKEFGDEPCRPDPDLEPEFNPSPNADWK